LTNSKVGAISHPGLEDAPPLGIKAKETRLREEKKHPEQQRKKSNIREPMVKIGRKEG